LIRALGICFLKRFNGKTRDDSSQYEHFPGTGRGRCASTEFHLRPVQALAPALPSGGAARMAIAFA
jgi:hypothetical protein